MKNKPISFKFLLMLSLFGIHVSGVQAVEQQVHGLVDVRYTLTDGIDSYLNGDYGKFRYDDGEQLSLAQGAASYRLSWENNFSALVVANAYVDGVKDNAGITEAYLQYKSLPSAAGYRLKVRGGLMYPKVSMTNLLTGWASPYTLTYSAINTWLGEELRHQGLDFSVTRLGRFSASDHDFELGLALFQANDPAGAVLSWHGWTISSRQTLRQENLALPNSHIGFVPDNSNVFSELDHRTGYHVNTQWTWHNHGKVLLGYYDNRADPRVVKDVQWAWETRFYHLGVKWQLAEELELIAQYVDGDTLMTVPSGGRALVNNDYDSAFIMLSKKLNQHRWSARIENFSVTDNDQISFDNNEEDGEAVTLNYTYRWNKYWFLHSEYSWVDSERPSRTGLDHPERLIERQWQFGGRYFF